MTKQTNNNTQNTLPPSLKSSFKTAYSPKQRHQITFTTQGKTKQSFKDECDINTIMKRYIQTGSLDHVNRAMPQFANVDQIDYQDSMFLVAESRSLFAELPAEIRLQFENDPGKFLDFVHDPDNKSEMARMGLLTPEAASRLEQATPAAPPPVSIQSTPPAAKPQASGAPLVPGDQA